MNSFVKLLKIIILTESCPKNCVGKIVQQFTSHGPMNCFRELPNKFTSKDCPMYLYRRVAHNYNKYFCLEMIFVHGLGICEGVGEDSRHEIGHVDIRVGIMNSLECVCFVLPLHEHLGGE